MYLIEHLHSQLNFKTDLWKSDNTSPGILQLRKRLTHNSGDKQTVSSPFQGILSPICEVPQDSIHFICYRHDTFTTTIGFSFECRLNNLISLLNHFFTSKVHVGKNYSTMKALELCTEILVYFCFDGSYTYINNLTVSQVCFLILVVI